jgi:hypothetical protein
MVQRVPHVSLSSGRVWVYVQVHLAV